MNSDKVMVTLSGSFDLDFISPRGSIEPQPGIVPAVANPEIHAPIRRLAHAGMAVARLERALELPDPRTDDAIDVGGVELLANALEDQLGADRLFVGER